MSDLPAFLLVKGGNAVLGPWPRCPCCGSLLTTKGTCAICDSPGLVCPPHYCIRTGRMVGCDDPHHLPPSP